MVLPALVIIFAAVVAALFWLLRKQPDRRRLSRTALLLGFGIGVARAALASWGWYVVEHTGGPHQIPAFALAMLAWPEAALVSERGVTAVPLSFYVVLSLVLVTSTMMFVSVVALAVGWTRDTSKQPRT